MKFVTPSTNADKFRVAPTVTSHHRRRRTWPTAVADKSLKYFTDRKIRAAYTGFDFLSLSVDDVARPVTSHHSISIRVTSYSWGDRSEGGGPVVPIHLPVLPLKILSKSQATAVDFGHCLVVVYPPPPSPPSPPHPSKREHRSSPKKMEIVHPPFGLLV